MRPPYRRAETTLRRSRLLDFQDAVGWAPTAVTDEPAVVWMFFDWLEEATWRAAQSEETRRALEENERFLADAYAKLRAIGYR
jgi:hypothetical protein